MLLELSSLLQIDRQSVDRSNTNIGIAGVQTCELAIDWKGQYGKDLPVLKRRVNLLGAKAPKNYFTLRICPPNAGIQ